MVSCTALICLYLFLVEPLGILEEQEETCAPRDLGFTEPTPSELASRLVRIHKPVRTNFTLTCNMSLETEGIINPTEEGPRDQLQCLTERVNTTCLNLVQYTRGLTPLPILVPFNTCERVVLPNDTVINQSKFIINATAQLNNTVYFCYPPIIQPKYYFLDVYTPHTCSGFNIQPFYLTTRSILTGTTSTALFLPVYTAVAILLTVLT